MIMDFSYHPKYENISEEIKSFLYNNLSPDTGVNFIAGGDGSLFTYADFSRPNFLLSSRRFSKGYYSACFFEDDYKSMILKYLNNPKKYEKEYRTIEILVNGKPLPERAINEVVIGKDYMLKAIFDKKEADDSGLFVYTPDGCNAWASKYGAKAYETLGYVFMDKGIPAELNGSLEIEILKYHDSEIMVDGKGHNLDLHYVHNSTKKRCEVFTKPWELREGDILTLKQGEPVKIVKNGNI
jgi:hypothetical protein